MKALFLTVLAFLFLFQPSIQTPTTPKWIKEGSYFKLYSMYLDEFVVENQKTLVVIYDSSEFSHSVLAEVESVCAKLAQKGIKLTLAKMFHGDGDRHIINWNVHHFPHLRLFVGEEVYIDLNMYPSSDNVYNELTRVLSANDTITEIKTEDDKERYLAEPLAFYLRIPRAKQELVYFLEKIQQLDNRVKVYFTFSPELDPFGSHKPENMVVGFRRDFDQQIKVLSSENRLDRATILKFYHAYRQPDVHTLDEELLYSILSKKIRSVVFFEEDEIQRRVDDFKRLAFTHKGLFLFVLANPKTPAGAELMDFAKIEKGTGDAIRILTFKEKDLTAYPVGTTNFDEMSTAINLFNKGALEPLSDGPFVDGEL